MSNCQQIPIFTEDGGGPTTANIANPAPYTVQREHGILPAIQADLFINRLHVARNLFRRDLVCHFGCVNAIEFSNNGEMLISGGDDRRVMIWKFGSALFNHGTPYQLKAVHQSNIFCIGITNDNRKIYSGGNDDIVIVHDMESRAPREVLQHQRAVCCLSIDPFCDQVVSTAGNDGRLLLFDTRRSVHESLVISRSRKAFHGVMYHPQQPGMLVSANAREGISLWDLRSPKQPMLRYNGNKGPYQNSMSVAFNATGTHILGLRRRLPPILYAVQSPEPLVEFYHKDYYNSCTMKSCSFAGQNDEYVMSGSDDFNLYVWQIPEVEGLSESIAVEPHLVLYGHRSIVNQVRYNQQYCVIASSGVEKIIKLWSPMEYPKMHGSLLEPVQGSENPRNIYSHEDYVSLVHHSGQYISHNYAEQSTNEDPRMLAFFDSLVQRELECVAYDTDSEDGSSSAASMLDQDSESSDTDQIVGDFLPLPPKREIQNGARSQRCPNRMTRFVGSRYSKNTRPQKRDALRRSKQSRNGGKSGGKCGRGFSGKGKSLRSRGLRRPTPAPSSERTDSDEPARALYRNSARMIRPLRRRQVSTRTVKRKTKTPCYRKALNLRKNDAVTTQDSSDNNNSTNNENYEDNLALPSTSTGYRGQNAPALFRIAEVDSDDDHSASSRPRSPNQNANYGVPLNLVSIVPTPVNGSRDSLGDSLRTEETHPTHPAENRLRNLRRVRRNGRGSLHRSDSSESPPLKDETERATTSLEGRLSPKGGYNLTIARLMNETNESELESSCSTESSVWPAPIVVASDRMIGGGSSQKPADDVSDDSDFQAVKFRQRVKKSRRNYRSQMDSDSN